MAANIGTGEQSGGKKRGRFSDNSDINVTPFVDVMLVLLIIFMVAAPLATVNIKLDLPPPDAEPKPQLEEPVFVSLQDTGQIFVGTQTEGETEATWATLRQVLFTRTGGNYKRKIFIRADQKTQYSDVMRMMDDIQDSGFHELSLVAEDVVD